MYKNTTDRPWFLLSLLVLIIPLNVQADKQNNHQATEFYYEDLFTELETQTDEGLDFINKNPSHEHSEQRIQAKSFVLDSVVWPYDENSGFYKIPVCWDNSLRSTPDEKNLVINAVKEWERNSLVKFEWNGTCTQGANGIRVKVDNHAATPRAALGTLGDGKIGVMILALDWTH